MTVALSRRFKLPCPLYELTSAWRQPVDSVRPKEPQHEYVHELYHLLRTARVNSCHLNNDDFTIPIFEARPSSGIGHTMPLRTYFNESWQTSTLHDRQVQIGETFGVLDIPTPEGPVRPSGPMGIDADGHLVLVDRVAGIEYDFFAATTEIDGVGQSLGGGHVGDMVQFAGAIECFNLSGPGAQKPDPQCRPRNSARATGVPLLAGLLVPEDFENGPEITHAMAFAIPRLRHIGSASEGTPRDYVYPATKTEKSAYIASTYAMGAGERIRLRESLFGNGGSSINEDKLAPVTRRFLKALRKYGAYLVDGAGGFAFYAEDVRTGGLELGLQDFNRLCGLNSGAPLREDVSQWRNLTEKLGEELELIPFAVRASGKLETNFDILEDAAIPLGFDPICGPTDINN